VFRFGAERLTGLADAEKLRSVKVFFEMGLTGFFLSDTIELTARHPEA